MFKKILIGLIVVILALGFLPSIGTQAVIQTDYVVFDGVRYYPGQEIISKRTENSKTIYSGGGGYRLEVSIGAIHYKDNYSNLYEQWKDIDLTWEGNRITTAPYELTIDGKKLTFRDKKTGEVSTLELLSVFPPGIPFEIKPFNEGVSFQHILPTDKIPFEAQFRVTGNARLITRAFDDKGDLELGTSLANGILTENLSQVKDRDTGDIRPAKGNIRIDPTLTVQPSAKDNFIDELGPTGNYGSGNEMRINDLLGRSRRPILEFNISGLPPGQALTSANLQLYYFSYIYTNPVGKIVWAYKLTRTNWVELESCWSYYRGTTPWTTPGGDYVTSSPPGGSTAFPSYYNQWMTWNVLAIVQDAYDGSIPAEFLVKFAIEGRSQDGDTEAKFYSREYTDNTSLRPKLVIDYIPVAPTVTTQAVSAIGTTTATGNGNITATGGENCDKRGIVYGTTSKGDPGAAAPPGGYDAYEEETNGFGTGAFTRSLTGLTPGQIYYARAYAHNSVGYNYGGEVNFYTLPGNPSNLSATTISDTRIDLTWTKGTGGDKTMVRRKEGSYPANEADGDQAYFDTASAHSDTGLDPNTLYYYRAWAYDTEGAQYSSGYTSDTATTYGPPTVTTSAATSVEETTATLEGEITALNDGNATERGFDWDIDSGAPYAYDWYGEGSFGIEAYDHDLTGLTKGELYYYRAYAVNGYGEGYGDEVKFLTKPDAPNTLDAVIGGATQVDLTWVKGTGAQKTYIRGKDGSYPADRDDGYLVYNDTGAACSDTGLTGGHIYYYRAWSYATEGGESQYSDLYDQDSVILTIGLELWFQPDAIIEDTVLVDKQGDYDGVITWGGRLADGGDFGVLEDSVLTQADDYWVGYTLKIKEVAGDAAPEGEEATITDSTLATLGGTADSGSTTTLVDATLTQTTAYWAAQTLTIVTTTDSGAPQGESKTVTTWDLPTNTLTFPAMTAEVDENDTYTLTAANSLFFDNLTAVVGANARYEIWDGQKILWGSFPAGISVEVGALIAYVDPVSGAVGGEDPEVAAAPQEPSGLWGGGATEDLPLYPLFNTVAADLGWTTDVLYVFASIIVSVGLGVALLVTTGSTLAAIGGVGVGMAGGMATGMLPVWVLIVYLILGGTWLYVSRSI